MYYSSSVNGFIPAAWKSDGTYLIEDWPTDAILLTEKELNTYARKPPPEGKQLGFENGRPVWIDAPSLPPLTREGVEALRLRAYADPLAGSDRYFSEVQRMRAMDIEGWEVVLDLGVARYEAIQNQYPWPTELSNLPGMHTVESRPDNLDVWGDNIRVFDEPLQLADLKREALAKREKLLLEAVQKVALFQYAKDIGDASDQEQLALMEWKLYSVELNRIQHQVGFPTDIDWPVMPEPAA